MSFQPFVAVDIGNARIKLGLFADGWGGSTTTTPTEYKAATGGRAESSVLPEPLKTLPLLGDAPELDAIAQWLADVPRCSGADIPVCPVECGLEGRQECLPHLMLHWRIASVNRPAATRLIDWLRVHRPNDRITLLACGDLPLEVRLERPDMVGIDRLVDAVAVNRLRDAGRPAAIVDVGTAITVDWVSADGAFLGGAILPGIRMSARALNEFTDLLPLVDVEELTEPPPALGMNTEAAMQSGMFWGAVGAIRELIQQLHCEAASGCALPPQVFLTGGAAVSVAKLLGPKTHYVPNLTLSGIALASNGETACSKNSC
jgi:type III pantothenate kinase